MAVMVKSEGQVRIGPPSNHRILLNIPIKSGNRENESCFKVNSQLVGDITLFCNSYDISSIKVSQASSDKVNSYMTANL